VRRFASSAEEFEPSAVGLLPVARVERAFSVRVRVRGQGLGVRVRVSVCFQLLELDGPSVLGLEFGVRVRGQG
jgi:hypothetical protein